MTTPLPVPTPWQSPVQGGVAPYTNTSNQTPYQGGTQVSGGFIGPVYSGSVQPAGQVQGVQAPTPVSNPSTEPWANASMANQSYNSGDSKLTELSKMGSSRNPSQESEYQALLSQQNQNNVPQGPSEGEINSIYDPTMNVLNQTESAVRQDFPTVLEAANKAWETAYAELEASKNKVADTITTAGNKAVQTKENALSAARRLFGELRQGYQQRFGGSTSAGQAAGELANVEQMRQQGGIQQNYQNTDQEISQMKVQLDKDYEVGSAKINQAKVEAVAQANRDFQNKILEISSQRGQVESAKAAAKLDALNTLRNQVYQASQEELAYKRSIDTWKMQQAAEIDTYKAKLGMSGSGATTASNNYNPAKPTSNLQVSSPLTQNNQVMSGIAGPGKTWDQEKQQWV
jgi:hypothetical protein